MNPGLFIVMDGLIAAGKSNLCHALGGVAREEGHDAVVLGEPVKQASKEKFLQRYYDDMRDGVDRGAGFIMQVNMLTQRLRQHKLAVELAWSGKIVLQDRPIYGDTVFIVAAHERGFVCDADLALYETLYKEMSRDIMPPDLFVYLEVPVGEAFKRIQERKRPEEEDVPIDYLKQLAAGQDRLVAEMRRRGIPVLVVDWSGYGPPVELWRRVEKLAREGRTGGRRYSIAWAKHPEMPTK